ncbi:MAG: ribosomal protein large subunit ribosomal protein [Candidatus Parcubacteria bacterium]|jgi:large subunit ribosomal protein L32
MVVRMRHTRSHTANRRSHHALQAPSLATCTNCSAKHRPHHMCLECGYYKGRMVVDMTAKKQAREARLLAKREAIQAQQGEVTTPATAEPQAEEKK